MPLVEVGTALQHRDGHAAESSEDERPRVTDRGRDGPAGDFAVRDLDRVLDRVREAAETAAEDDTHLRAKRHPTRDRLDRLVELRAHAEPSCRRSATIATIRSTASSRSSVTISRSKSWGETSPSTSISSRTHSSISSQ